MATIKQIIWVMLSTLIILVPTLLLAGMVADRCLESRGCDYSVNSSYSQDVASCDDACFFPFMITLFGGFLIYSIAIVSIFIEDKEKTKLHGEPKNE